MLFWDNSRETDKLLDYFDLAGKNFEEISKFLIKNKNYNWKLFVYMSHKSSHSNSKNKIEKIKKFKQSKKAKIQSALAFFIQHENKTEQEKLYRVSEKKIFEKN